MNTAQNDWLMRGWQRLPGTIVVLVLCAMTPLTTAAAELQKSFGSPAAGVSALVEAVRSNDQKLLLSILGARSRRLVSSGDGVADERNREAFLKAYGEANRIEFESETATLMIGEDEWPLPIPLVKSGGRWRFDARQGQKELLARRIGANELAAIQVCLAIADAEHEYAQHAAAVGVPHYAARLVSTPGKRDGLYWETLEDEPPSPLGPLLAAAANEGYGKSGARALAPYHGYYYKLLTSQGANAQGGAYDYIVKGKMIGGFAVIAYPARYGASGIMTFTVNHDGVVYEKNLGRYTTQAAEKITTFNPDASWKRSE